MTMPVGHVHLTIIPYTKYSRPIAYSIRQTYKTQKRNITTEPWKWGQGQMMSPS